MGKFHAGLAIVVLTAIAVASVVAAHGKNGAAATPFGVGGAESVATAGLADTSAIASSTSSGLTGVDPAKQTPNLDQFTSHDPFIQVTAAPSVGSVSSSSTPSEYAADIRLTWPSGGATYTLRRVGDKLPPSSPVFEVTSIGASGVTFALLNGYRAAGRAEFGPVQGSGAATEVKLQKGTQQIPYTVTVLWMGSEKGAGRVVNAYGTGAASDTASTTNATRGTTHDIKLLAVNLSNGDFSAILSVDGATVGAQHVGDVATTKWGQIKTLGINVVARTVTILHGDAQLTLGVGQSSTHQ
jgi:hypothetical protein